MTSDGSSAELSNADQSSAENVGEKTDFEQLNALGRTIWPTYFGLASMTFAWNASLAAGLGFITYSRADATLLLSLGSLSALALFAAYAICLIGVVYNLGAYFAYKLMTDTMRGMIVQISGLPDALSRLRTARLLNDMAPDQRRGALEVLTYMFFWMLAAVWVGAGIAVGREIGATAFWPPTILGLLFVIIKVLKLRG